VRKQNTPSPQRTRSQRHRPQGPCPRRKERQGARMQGQRPAGMMPADRPGRRAASRPARATPSVSASPAISSTRHLANSSMSIEETAQPPGQLTFADGAGLGLIVSAWRSLPPPMITLPGRSVPPSPHSLPPTCLSSGSTFGPRPQTPGAFCPEDPRQVLRICEGCRRVKAADPPSP
jgi:hypothetical protein